MIENIKYCYIFSLVVLWIVVCAVNGISILLFTCVDRERLKLFKHRFKFLGVGLILLIFTIIVQNLYFLIYGVD